MRAHFFVEQLKQWVVVFEPISGLSHKWFHVVAVAVVAVVVVVVVVVGNALVYE